ncbi:MAG: hypothetical protein II003_04065 [Methanobrevibacter sp.]|nr:hypothetical protein [Methanobrevibacter sp.]
MQYFISHYNKECELTIPEDLIIYDTTLRDGEQTPGVCFSFEDKIEIAHKLDQIKITSPRSPQTSAAVSRTRFGSASSERRAGFASGSGAT